VTVLARELQAYQTAVDQYNRNVQAFGNSLVKDANGNILVYKDGKYYSVPPEGGEATKISEPTGFSGKTPSSGDPSVYLLRRQISDRQAGFPAEPTPPGPGPDPTNAQLRKMNTGSWADAERASDLDAGIIRSGGLKVGLRVQAPPPNSDLTDQSDS